MGSTVSADGMQVQAVSGGALLIDLANDPFVGNASVTFEPKTDKLNALHYNGTGYEYVTDPTAVDRTTGSTTSGNLTVMTDETTGKYYIDYLAYVAAGETYTTAGLAAEVDFAGTKFTNNRDTLQATTVDFWTKEVAAGVDAEDSVTNTMSGWTLWGTVNAVECTTSNTTVDVSVKDGAAITTIPLKSEKVIAVLMRVYFDGALTFKYDENTDYYYVRSSQVNTDAVSIAVTFTAEATA